MSHKHPKPDSDEPPKGAQPQEEAQDQSAGAEQPSAEQAPAPQGAQVSIQALQAERDDLMDRLKRVSADYVNYQKRAHRDIVQAREFANEELIKSMLHVLDDMERALEHAKENHAPDDPLLVGMEMVRTKALETMGRYGLSVIEAQGKPFNPEEHAALMQQPSAEHAAGTVLKEVQKGYQLKGRVIRPAQVIVSKEPEDTPKQ
jgi:molecular chaperone GrpE